MKSNKSAATSGKSAKKKSSDDFYRKVYEVVAEIPEGRVTTYGSIAAFLGLRSSARLVGYALRSVDEEMCLPCHRVVNRNGELSGRHNFATPNLMRDLLESEGIRFIDDAVDMSEHFWDPVELNTQYKSPAKRRRENSEFRIKNEERKR